jgi:hypothetical protein
MKFMLGLVLTISGITGSLLAADFAPSFIQVGKYYLGDIDVFDAEFLVLEIGDQGWIKVESDGKNLWVNTTVMSNISEMSVEDQRAYDNKIKQKVTMANMRAISIACETYAVENNFYPYSSSGKAADLIGILQPTYAKTLPIKDGWGQEILYYTDATFQQYWIISFGADGKMEKNIYGNDGIPLSTAEGVIKDVEGDVIFSEGSFLRVPEGIAR